MVDNAVGEKPIRLLIVDDHFIVREGLRLIFETTDGIDLVGEASDGAQAVRLVAELSPHVLLMDLRMPGMDGLTAIETLREQNLKTPVIILTTYDEDDSSRITCRCCGLFIERYQAGNIDKCH